jgi:hypothetical protein
LSARWFCTAFPKSDPLRWLNKPTNTVVCLVIVCISFWYIDLWSFLYTILKIEIQAFSFLSTRIINHSEYFIDYPFWKNKVLEIE